MDHDDLIPCPRDDIRLHVLRELSVSSDLVLAPLAERLSIRPLELVAVLNDNAVVKTIHSQIRAACLLLLQQEGVERLRKIIQSGKDSHAIKAVAMLRDLALDQPKLFINAKLSFDDLNREAAPAAAGPLAGLTEIEGEALDAEIYEETHNVATAT